MAWQADTGRRELDSYRRRVPAKLRTQVLFFISVPVLAVGAGIWAGTWVSARPKSNCESLLRRVHTVPQLAGNGAVATVIYENFSNVAPMAANHRATNPAGGFANVYDREGRLVERFTVIDRSESSVELIEELGIER